MVEKLMHAKLVGGERYGNFYIYIRSLIQGTEKKKKMKPILTKLRNRKFGKRFWGFGRTLKP
jgi:hypothetical protein